MCSTRSALATDAGSNEPINTVTLNSQSPVPPEMEYPQCLRINKKPFYVHYPSKCSAHIICRTPHAKAYLWQVGR